MPMTCWICGKDFEPDPARLREWAESGVQFDPTDWECPECQTFWRSDAEVADA